jgi:hypothetical protein
MSESTLKRPSQETLQTNNKNHNIEENYKVSYASFETDSRSNNVRKEVNKRLFEEGLNTITSHLKTGK